MLQADNEKAGKHDVDLVEPGHEFLDNVIVHLFVGEEELLGLADEGPEVELLVGVLKNHMYCIEASVTR